MLQMCFKNFTKEMTTNDNIPKDCNEGKHFFINSEFCDRCDIDFDDWYAHVIEQAHKDVVVYLLKVLKALTNEQYIVRQLKRSTGDYIVQGVKDAAEKEGWIEK